MPSDESDFCFGRKWYGKSRFAALLRRELLLVLQDIIDSQLERSVLELATPVGLGIEPETLIIPSHSTL